MDNTIITSSHIKNNNNNNNNIDIDNNNISDYDKNLYRLFKLVFNNIFLTRKIFKYARHTNRQISNSNIKNKSFVQRCRYDEVNFDWMVRNKHFELLCYKINTNTIFEQEDLTINSLKTFFQTFNVDQNNNNNNNFSFDKIVILNKFYQNHKMKIINLPPEGLLGFAIKCQNLKFLEMVYADEDLKEQLEYELYEPKQFEKDPVAIQNLLHLSLKTNINIVKYVHQVIGIQLNVDDIIIDNDEENDSVDNNENTTNDNDSLIEQINIVNGLSVSENNINNNQHNGADVSSDASSDLSSDSDASSDSSDSSNENNNNNNNNNHHTNFNVITSGLSVPSTSSNQINNFTSNNKFDFKNYYKKSKEIIEIINIIHTALISDDRNSIIEYLIDEIKFAPIFLKTVLTSFGYDFKNLALLEPSLFKRIYEMGWLKSLMKTHSTNSFFNNFIALIMNNSTFIHKRTTKVISFNNFINFLKNCLFLLSTFEFDKNNKYESMLRKINYLFEINKILTNNQDSNQIEINCNTIGSGNNNNNNNNNNISISLSSNIFFKNFNLEREIKRIYLFEFLSSVKSSVKVCGEKWATLIFEFSCQYGEYSFVNSNFIFESGNEKSSRACIGLQLSKVAIKYADSKILELMPFLFEYSKFKINENRIQCLKDQLPTDEYFDPRTTDFDKQIKFISTLFKFNIDSKEIILANVFNNSVNLNTPAKFDEIAEIIKQYYYSIEQTKASTTIYSSSKISALALVGNEEVFKYYYNNHRKLFKWDDKSISDAIVGSGNIELISFNHYHNDIGALNISSSINLCKTRKVAEYMYDKLGFRFSGNLSEISRLAEFESNYLFYYAMDKLIKDSIIPDSKTINKKPTIIYIGLDIYRNYKQRKYIESLFIHSLLNDKNFRVGNAVPDLENPPPTNNTELFRSLYDINVVISVGNCKYIKQFINENPELVKNLSPVVKHKILSLYWKYNDNRKIIELYNFFLASNLLDEIKLN